MCRMTHVRCQVSHFFLQSVEALLVEGLLSTEPTPSSLEFIHKDFTLFKINVTKQGKAP